MTVQAGRRETGAPGGISHEKLYRGQFAQPRYFIGSVAQGNRKKRANIVAIIAD